MKNQKVVHLNSQHRAAHLSAHGHNQNSGVQRSDPHKGTSNLDLPNYEIFPLLDGAETRATFDVFAASLDPKTLDHAHKITFNSSFLKSNLGYTGTPVPVCSLFTVPLAHVASIVLRQNRYVTQ